MSELVAVNPVYTPYIRFVIGPNDNPLLSFDTNEADTLISLDNDDNSVTSDFKLKLAIVPKQLIDLSKVDIAINEAVTKYKCECHLTYGYVEPDSSRTATYSGLITGYTTDIHNGYLIYNIEGSTCQSVVLNNTMLKTSINFGSMNKFTSSPYITYKILAGQKVSRSIRRFYYYIIRVAGMDKDDVFDSATGVSKMDISHQSVPYYKESYVSTGKSYSYPKGKLSNSGVYINRYFSNESETSAAMNTYSAVDGTDYDNTYGGSTELGEWIFVNSFSYDHNLSIGENLASILAMSVVPIKYRADVKAGTVDMDNAVALNKLISIQFGTRRDARPTGTEMRVVFYNPDYAGDHNVSETLTKSDSKKPTLQYIFNWGTYESSNGKYDHRVIKFTPKYDGAVLASAVSSDYNAALYSKVRSPDYMMIKPDGSNWDQHQEYLRSYQANKSNYKNNVSDATISRLVSKQLTGTELDAETLNVVEGSLYLARRYPYRAELEVVGTTDDWTILSTAFYICPLVNGYPHFSRGFYRVLGKRDSISNSGFTTTYTLLRATDQFTEDEERVPTQYNYNGKVLIENAYGKLEEVIGGN